MVTLFKNAEHVVIESLLSQNLTKIYFNMTLLLGARNYNTGD